MKHGAAVAALPCLATAGLAAAQGAPGRRQLGVLLHDRAALWEDFRRELSPALGQLSWQEGRNLAADEWRFANGKADRHRRR